MNLQDFAEASGKWGIELSTRIGEVKRLILARLCEKIVSTIQRDKLAGQVLKRGTGDLAAATTYRVEGDDRAYILNSMVYARIQEEGGIIMARHADYLKFKIGDGWVQVKQVTIPAHWYIKSSINEWLTEDKGHQLVQLTLQQKLDEILGAKQ